MNTTEGVLSELHLQPPRSAAPAGSASVPNRLRRTGSYRGETRTLKGGTGATHLPPLLSVSCSEPVDAAGLLTGYKNRAKRDALGPSRDGFYPNNILRSHCAPNFSIVRPLDRLLPNLHFLRLRSCLQPSEARAAMRAL